jgi:hypothetical protein
MCLNWIAAGRGGGRLGDGWQSRRDLPAGGNPIHRPFAWEDDAIVEQFNAWGAVDPSHRKLAHRGSYIGRVSPSTVDRGRSRGAAGAWVGDVDLVGWLCSCVCHRLGLRRRAGDGAAAFGVGGDDSVVADARQRVPRPEGSPGRDGGVVGCPGGWVDGPPVAAQVAQHRLDDLHPRRRGRLPGPRGVAVSSPSWNGSVADAVGSPVPCRWSREAAVAVSDAGWRRAGSLGLASSSNRPVIDAVLTASGLGSCFSVTVYSEEVGPRQALSRRLSGGRFQAQDRSGAVRGGRGLANVFRSAAAGGMGGRSHRPTRLDALVTVRS